MGSYRKVRLITIDVAAFAAILFGGIAGVSHGGVITAFGPSSGPGLGFANFAFAPADPANHTVAGNKIFDHLDFIDFKFTVANSGGITKYIFSEAVINHTGFTWSDFHFTLIPTTANDGLNFAATPTPTSIAFLNLAQTEDTLSWSGGAVPPNSFDQFTFSINVPDNLPADTFTLREIATVPEPSTLLLLGFGLADWRPWPKGASAGVNGAEG